MFTFYNSPESIKGKRVLVTGASSGIGEQMAYHYARMGASIVLTARRETLLQKVVEKCKLIGAKTATFDYITADMSKLEQTKGVVEVILPFLEIHINHWNKYMTKYMYYQNTFSAILAR